MNKEEELFKKRLQELSNISYRRDIITFTDFMNLNELNIFHSTKKEFASIKWELFGGYKHAERQMAVFLPDAFYDIWKYPISCVKIAPGNIKFAGPLNHRDYLGAILNIGIERHKIGDIILQDKQAFVFCHESLCDFISLELTKVKHTTVKCTKVVHEFLDVQPNLKSVQGTVASIRLDTVMALVSNSSRSSLVGLIEGGKVFVNGKLITSNGYNLSEEDIVSVRGQGRFKYKGILKETKKNKFLIEVDKYI